MVDVNPEIWDNKTLGDAAHNENLDRLEKQAHEDRAARLEGREPREVIVERTYPDWTPPVQERTGTVPSNYQVVHFADEQPHEVLQTGEGVKPEGMDEDEWNTEGEQQEFESEVHPEQENSEGEEVSSEGVPVEDSESVDSPSEEPYGESEPNPSEESDSTKWT